MPKKPKAVTSLRHEEAKRKNIPTAEYESLVRDQDITPIDVVYERRNRDLDPQLVWRGKDEQDWSNLVVPAPPLYIQEKVHPKALIDDLLRESKERQHAAGEIMADMFADFNGIPKGVDKTDFYHHDQNWSNRMILGDSLQVMASLAEREGLRGKVQCIYFDPPYGIKFNSNFQWSTTSRDVKDGAATQITREPEQVKAFRDTWRDGIHSYLTYLRDRLIVARDLLAETGSIFVQIGDENVHRVRAVLDETFGDANFVSEIVVVKSSGLGATTLPRQNDYILMYARNIEVLKYRQILRDKIIGGEGGSAYQYARGLDGAIRRLGPDEVANPESVPDNMDAIRLDNLTKPGPGAKYDVIFNGAAYTSGKRWWGVPSEALARAIRAGRVTSTGSMLAYLRFFRDWKAFPLTNVWTDTGTGGGLNKIYVVQTDEKIVQRCILMATDPGDLVLDPTCGSGTTATLAEQWGRRWITIDTSRVALALARARIMGARYSFYLLADSREGQQKEAEITHLFPSEEGIHGDIRKGFVYERVPHITLKSIANNTEIDTISEKWQANLEPHRAALNAALEASYEEWEIPREAGRSWPQAALTAHSAWWEARIARQREIDASITAKAEFEYLYDKPYEDKKTVRVAGPFTVESLDARRVLGTDGDGGIIDPAVTADGRQSFAEMILENLRMAGVQQATRGDKIVFTSLVPWPGNLICGEGTYHESQTASAKRAAIFIGPEFGTVSRPDLVVAAREAAEAGFDVLIACAFAFEAHTTEFENLGKLQVLKARMNADLHMAEELKNTGKGNLFIVFGEPDIEIAKEADGQLRVSIQGVSVFDPNTGEVRSDTTDTIACWFIDTDYNEESFFVRHAYFLGANDPYDALKKTLKAEIDREAWESLHSDTSRPFPVPKSGRIAVKVINYLGDEVLKVIDVA